MTVSERGMSYVYLWCGVWVTMNIGTLVTDGEISADEQYITESS